MQIVQTTPHIETIHRENKKARNDFNNQTVPSAPHTEPNVSENNKFQNDCN